MTWHCRACGQVGRVLQVANLKPDPVPAPVLEPEPEPESARDLLTRVTSGAGPPEPELDPADWEKSLGPGFRVFTAEEESQQLMGHDARARAGRGFMKTLRDAWAGETSKDREATAAGVPPDLLESIGAAADQVARETRAPRKGDR